VNCFFSLANSTLLCDGTTSKLSLWLGVFIVGMILSGIGGTTLYSVGIVFMDNCVSTKSFPLYYGKLGWCPVIKLEEK